MTPSWDSIRASSWRTLMRRGFAPMTCSAWRCTILVKTPHGYQEGRWRMGVLPWWRPNLSIGPSFITLKRISTGLQQSITENMQAYTVLPLLLKKHVSLLKAHTSIKRTPFSFANLHDDGELKYQRTPWPGQKRINLTSAVWYLHFSCWFWLFEITTVLLSLFALVQSVLSACF